MRKRILLGAIIPLVAAASVIGSGYALFIFNENNSTSALNQIAVNVEAVATIGDIETAGQAKLNFDQTSTALNGINSKGTGLTFDYTVSSTSADDTTDATETGTSSSTTSSTTDLTAKYLFSSSATTTNKTYYDDDLYVTFTTVISIPSDVANYVKLSSTTYVDGSGYTWTEGSNTTTSATTYTITEKIKTSEKYTVDNSGYKFFELSKITPSYVENKEPTTSSAHTEMINAVSGKTITIAYAAVLSVEPDAGN